MMKKYRQKYGTDIYEFYNLTLAGFFRYKKKVIKHNIKTLIKWNKECNNFYPKNKKIKTYKRYEMSELWHLQHDIKILTPNMTGFKRNLYFYDFLLMKNHVLVLLIYLKISHSHQQLVFLIKLMMIF